MINQLLINEQLCFNFSSLLWGIVVLGVVSLCLLWQWVKWHWFLCQIVYFSNINMALGNITLSITTSTRRCYPGVPDEIFFRITSPIILENFAVCKRNCIEKILVLRFSKLSIGMVSVRALQHVGPKTNSDREPDADQRQIRANIFRY